MEKTMLNIQIHICKWKHKLINKQKEA